MRLLLICLPLLLVKADDANPTLIETFLGHISGKRIDVLDNQVDTYLGIPYAKPPVGDLRFERPVPLEPFNDTFSAKKLPPSCMQVAHPVEFPWFPIGKKNEDCLYLNIWVPVTNDTSPKAVMVWIYGGGFLGGSSNIDYYDGAVLASKGDVIVVTFNYRVGNLGFLNLGVQEASGNMGLYDQHLALRWIKANIICFGGDSSRITLFGESVGGMSISIHLTSPISHGLFNRGILQSGTAYQPYYFITERKSLQHAKRFVELAGCGNKTYRGEVLACLKNVSGKDLVKAEAAMYRDFQFMLPRIGDEMIPREPWKTMDSGLFSNADIMIGGTKNEGAIFLILRLPMIFLDEVRSNMNRAEGKKLLVDYMNNATNVKEIDTIADIYFQDVKDNSTEVIDALSRVMGDWDVNCPSIYLANKFPTRYNRVYYYQFSHDHNPTSSYPEWVKSTHFDEVPYIFGTPLVSKEDYTKEDKRFSENLISLWSTFAKEGKPKSPYHYHWPPYTASNPVVLELNATKADVHLAPSYDICTKVWGPLYFQSPLRHHNWPVWFHF